MQKEKFISIGPNSRFFAVVFLAEKVPTPEALSEVKLAMERAKIFADFAHDKYGIATRNAKGIYTLIVPDDEAAGQAREFLTENCGLVSMISKLTP